MKIYQLFTVLFVLTLGALFANAATPAAPDPSGLAADWWTYLEPKETLDSAALSERVAAIDSLLKEYITQPTTSGQTEYIALAKQIINDLKLFNKLKSEPLPPAN